MLLQSDKYSSHHVFIDEIHIETDADFEILKNITKLFDDDGRTLWLTVTSMNPKFSVRIRTEFATDFYFPSDLVYPLRNSSQIINYAYDIQGNFQNYTAWIFLIYIKNYTINVSRNKYLATDWGDGC